MNTVRMPGIKRLSTVAIMKAASQSCVVILALLALACQGPPGLQGKRGPRGKRGPPGPEATDHEHAPPAPPKTQPAVQQPPAQVGPGAEPQTEATPTNGEATPPEVGTLIPVETFVVNLNTENANRYLKLTIQLEINRSGMEEAVAKRMPLIQQKVITYLTGLSWNDVRGADAKNAIRDMLLKRINEVFGAKDFVRNVYFTEFVVQ